MRLKERVLSPEASQFFQVNDLDTSNVNILLQQGNVDFGKSETDREPCNIYFVTKELDERTLELQIENCDSTATIIRAAYLK